MAGHTFPHDSLNFPEENDETMSQDFQPMSFPGAHPTPDGASDVTLSKVKDEEPVYHQNDHWKYKAPHLPQHLWAGYSLQTPFPSQAEIGRSNQDTCHGPTWHYPSYVSGSHEGEGYSNSLPSYLPSTEFHSYTRDDYHTQMRPLSLPGRHSPSIVSLEQPRSLHSFPPGPALLPHSHSPFPGHHMNPAFCGQCGPTQPRLIPAHLLSPRPGYHLPHGLSGPDHYRHAETDYTKGRYTCPKPRQANPSCTHLSQEQRKVFVTYEADSDDHVKEIIKFVALLRSNGFDTHIDVFEQHLNSISKIDCMERYLNEKDYLIIIIISMKYYETVTGGNISMDNDERTLNTVYIHKQLQSEFIQNGCKNFRFIPILFPGAKRCHVPAWLQNTHIYSWPRDRDDILRRLMRVEKYNPPPIGPLPTIVSIPI